MGTETRLRAGIQRKLGSILDTGKRFSLLQIAYMWRGIHPTSYSMRADGLFLGKKAAGA
jgi:hypothetical protein